MFVIATKYDWSENVILTTVPLHVNAPAYIEGFFGELVRYGDCELFDVFCPQDRVEGEYCRLLDQKNFAEAYGEETGYWRLLDRECPETA